jgi:hypothetical protein
MERTGTQGVKSPAMVKNFGINVHDISNLSGLADTPWLDSGLRRNDGFLTCSAFPWSSWCLRPPNDEKTHTHLRQTQQA